MLSKQQSWEMLHILRTCSLPLWKECPAHLFSIGLVARLKIRYLKHCCEGQNCAWLVLPLPTYAAASENGRGKSNLGQLSEVISLRISLLWKYRIHSFSLDMGIAVLPWGNVIQVFFCDNFPSSYLTGFCQKARSKHCKHKRSNFPFLYPCDDSRNNFLPTAATDLL